MEDKVRAVFEISGYVQGVGFRYFVYRKANELGLDGYATNKYDGSVEVIAEGDKEAIIELHKYLKAGPSRSSVDSCKVIWEVYTGRFGGFNIK